MANPSTVRYQLAAAVSNGIAQSQAVAAAGPLTLNGSLVSGGVATFDTARRVVIASSSAGDAAVIFTVRGTDRYGNAQSSPVTGVVSGTPVWTALDFLTVTSITVASAAAGNITAGTNGVGSSDWVVDNFLAPDWSLTVRCAGPAGTNYTVEDTLDDPCFVPNQGVYNFSIAPGSNSPPVAIANATINNVSGNNAAQYPPGSMIYAHRLTIVSGTGQVTMQSIQAGIGSP